MKDKIVPMFEEELKNRFSKNSKIKRVVNEIFSINDRIFIINSKPDLISNITICIKTLLKNNRGLQAKNRLSRMQGRI